MRITSIKLFPSRPAAGGAPTSAAAVKRAQAPPCPAKKGLGPASPHSASLSSRAHDMHCAREVSRCSTRSRECYYCPCEETGLKCGGAERQRAITGRSTTRRLYCSPRRMLSSTSFCCSLLCLRRRQLEYRDKRRPEIRRGGRGLFTRRNGRALRVAAVEGSLNSRASRGSTALKRSFTGSRVREFTAKRRSELPT